MVKAVAVAGDQVIRMGGVALVSSKSEPGSYHEVKDVGGVLCCCCKGFLFRGHCRHVAAVVSVERTATPVAPVPAVPRVAHLYD